MATRAGEKVGILQQITHLLIPLYLSAINKAQIRSVIKYTTLGWMGAASTTLKKLETIQNIAVRLTGKI